MRLLGSFDVKMWGMSHSARPSEGTASCSRPTSCAHCFTGADLKREHTSSLVFREERGFLDISLTHRLLPSSLTPIYLVHRVQSGRRWSCADLKRKNYFIVSFVSSFIPPSCCSPLAWYSAARAVRANVSVPQNKMRYGGGDVLA